jgi:hypothetical protein
MDPKFIRHFLNVADNLFEATLTPAQIVKYPERFDAFINHIRDSKPFFTEKEGTEVVLNPAEADRFLKLNQQGQFKGGLKGVDMKGGEWPLSGFRKTAEFGGASAKPGDEEGDVSNKEGVQVKPSQIGICDKLIPAHALLGEITTNQVLSSTEYGKVVIALANNIGLQEPAALPKEMVKNTAIKKAIVDYAGEYLGVLALVMGQTEFPNRKEFLNWLESDISGLVLNFPSKVNNPLADSFATIANPSNDRQLNISSKGTGGGAAPSISGLVIPENVRKKKAYKVAVDIIDVCQNKSLPSPTSISQIFQVMNLLNEHLPEKIPKEFKPFLPWDISIINQVRDSMKQGSKMPKYRSLFADLVSKGEDGGKLTYVTKLAVMKIINSGAVPEFQACVLEILDYNFIQQYTTIENKTGKLRFVTQWPAKLDGKVTIETKSGGTDPTKGGFSFKLKPAGASADEDLPELPQPSAAEVDQETDVAVDKVLDPHLSLRPNGAADSKPRAKKVSAPRAKR